MSREREGLDGEYLACTESMPLRRTAAKAESAGDAERQILLGTHEHQTVGEHEYKRLTPLNQIEGMNGRRNGET